MAYVVFVFFLLSKRTWKKKFEEDENLLERVEKGETVD